MLGASRGREADKTRESARSEPPAAAGSCVLPPRATAAVRKQAQHTTQHTHTRRRGLLAGTREAERRVRLVASPPFVRRRIAALLPCTRTCSSSSFFVAHLLAGCAATGKCKRAARLLRTASISRARQQEEESKQRVKVGSASGRWTSDIKHGGSRGGELELAELCRRVADRESKATIPACDQRASC